MNPKQIQPPPGLTLADIYYVLFRHKWKIIIISVLGIIGAAAYFTLYPQKYSSEAQLLIRYIVDTKAPTKVIGRDGGAAQVEEGESAINTEMAILKSFDLASAVASNLSTRASLSMSVAGLSELNASEIGEKLKVASVNRSKVVSVRFEDAKSAEEAQHVLDVFLKTYLGMRLSANRFSDLAYEKLNSERTTLENTLVQKENALIREKTNANILSLEDSKKALTEGIAKARDAMSATEAEISQSAATVRIIVGDVPQSETNQVSTNLAVLAEVPAEIMANYKRMSDLLENLRNQEQQVALTFKPESERAREVQRRIAEIEQAKMNLEQKHPGLVARVLPESKTGSPDPSQPSRLTLFNEMTRLRGLEAKFASQSNQLYQLRREAASLATNEFVITPLERQK